MKKLLFFCALLLAASGLNADDVYVVPAGTHVVDPGWVYTNWATAATNIQDAINAAHVDDGDTVFITNGLYLLPDEIIVEKGVTLRSYMDGETAPEETIIDGNNFEGKPVTNRVMWLEHSGAVLDGLTIQGGQTHGNASGGGIRIEASQMITNCIIRDNHAATSADVGGNGGGLYIAGPFGVITHSQITTNVCRSSGGGILLHSSSSGAVEHCDIGWNECLRKGTTGAGGGGIRMSSPDVVVRWSTIHHNQGGRCNGGVMIGGGGVVENSIIVSNLWVGSTGASGVTLRDGNSVIRNSLIAYNGEDATDTRPAVIFHYDGGGIIENCTIVDNHGRGIIRYDERGFGVVVNTVIAGHVREDVIIRDTMSFTNSLCPTVDLNEQGTGNIQADPMFVDPDAGNFRLQPESPCVNAGVYLEDWMDDAVDLDGNPRIDRLYGQVDIGAYEYMFRGTLFRMR